MRDMSDRKVKTLDATETQLVKARKNALRRAGVTELQLREQARTGQFDSVQARLAWIVVKPLA
jgi:hypothetical protein